MINQGDIAILFTKNPNKNPEVIEWYKKNGDNVHVFTFGKEMFEAVQKLLKDGFILTILSIGGNYIVTKVVVPDKGKLYNDMFTLTVKKNNKLNISYMGQLTPAHDNINLAITKINVHNSKETVFFALGMYDALGYLIGQEVFS